jgi:hypothetical protein
MSLGTEMHKKVLTSMVVDRACCNNTATILRRQCYNWFLHVNVYKQPHCQVKSKHGSRNDYRRYKNVSFGLNQI